MGQQEAYFSLIACLCFYLSWSFMIVVVYPIVLMLLMGSKGGEGGEQHGD